MVFVTRFHIIIPAFFSLMTLIPGKTCAQEISDTSIAKSGRLAGLQSELLIPYNYQYPYNKKRVIAVGTTQAALYGVAMIGLYNSWYRDFPRTSMHSFDDLPEWKGMDKMGHVWSSYMEGKVSMEMWRWTGIERKKRIWLGGLSGFAYQTVIEVLDGYCVDWGWSWSDIAANAIGSGAFIAQELAWDEQKIQIKWSFHRKSYSDPVLDERSDDIFGKGSAARMLKDYNGQTYWLSTGLKNLFPQSRIPAWLQVSVGTGVENVFGARSNVAYDEDGNVKFDRSELKRYRQWYISPDIDLTKIPTRKKGIRFMLNVLNVIKVPAPSLEYGNGKFGFNWISF